VDLSAEGGGNCELTQPGETVRAGPATIVAPFNVPSLLGEDASELYSKNQYNLLALFVKDNVVKLDWGDEVIAGTCLTHAGKLMGKPGGGKTKPAGGGKVVPEKPAAKAA
jgi:NAD(P) transhydrogenase subunit alpha